MAEKSRIVLYIKGNAKALTNPNIAVVVSGLALGCDKIAHEATVDEGKATIAVLSSGVNIVTPASHKNLAKSILATGGCLISEYETNVKANRSYFVERDAIVAALSDVTFVVECDVKSGTMHTVDAASEYKRRLSCYYPPSMEMASKRTAL